ncbi:hypothetical protein CEE35_01960 [Candidatus Aerophobetes bacterium Ae_b3b]|nr:MAG: hypothetical protein CEE35_01960 [Candidatus Aerophobetes bacterium Ae_b3b]
MTQTQILGFVIENGSVTSADVANRFGVPVTFAHQVLRRLEDKRVLAKDGGPYRYEFQLSSEARKKLENVSNNNHKDYGWIFLLGLAVGLLAGFAFSNKGSKKDDATKKES